MGMKTTFGIQVRCFCFAITDFLRQAESIAMPFPCGTGDRQTQPAPSPLQSSRMWRLPFHSVVRCHDRDSFPFYQISASGIRHGLYSMAANADPEAANRQMEIFCSGSLWRTGASAWANQLAGIITIQKRQHQECHSLSLRYRQPSCPDLRCLEVIKC